MRRLVLLLILAAALARPASAQVAPAQTAPAATACVARAANLGGIGRASIVAFTGAVFGDRVCATVANLAQDAFRASLTDAPDQGALAVAALNAAPPPLTVAEGALVLPAATSAAPGAYLIAPGGQIAVAAGDSSTVPRLVLAYAGGRVLLVATSPVTLLDLARALRDQPDLFGADAVERALLVASGPSVALTLQTDDGVFGPALSPAARSFLVLEKRG